MMALKILIDVRIPSAVVLRFSALLGFTGHPRLFSECDFDSIVDILRQADT
jgi:hypothetical protein